MHAYFLCVHSCLGEIRGKTNCGARARWNTFGSNAALSTVPTSDMKEHTQTQTDRQSDTCVQIPNCVQGVYGGVRQKGISDDQVITRCESKTYQTKKRG